MNPLSALDEKLAFLPAYWEPRVALLSSACTAEGVDLSLRSLLFAMRDMPYERPEGSNSARACVAQWRGTCSAKHAAAYELLGALGLRPAMWLACYRFDFGRPYYSEGLRRRAGGLAVYDVHNYLTCEFNGAPRVIDITFPACLGPSGFPVTESWTGGEDFVLCCLPDAVQEVPDLDQADPIKRAWLRALNSDDALEIREHAILELMDAAKREAASQQSTFNLSDGSIS